MSGFLGGLWTRPKTGIVKGVWLQLPRFTIELTEAGKGWGVSFLIETKNTYNSRYWNSVGHPSSACDDMS